MTEFTVTTNVTVRCAECRGELLATTNTDKRSAYNGDVEVQHCECGDDAMRSEGADSRDDEVRELEEDISRLTHDIEQLNNENIELKTRITELEKELESLNDLAIERGERD